MKICLLGSTGRTGSAILNLAQGNGHALSLLVRDKAKLPELTDSIYIMEGTARSKHDLLQAMDNCDAVISALSTDGGDLLTQAMPLIIEAMEQKKIKRIVTIGTAGILQSRAEPHLLRYESSESRRKLTRAAEEHRTVYERLASSNLDWTIVCPTYLPEGDVTGKYRTEEDRLPEGGTSISTGDTAEFAYKCLVEGLYIGKRVGISY
jgi:putative NADH-flavin reductase